MKKAFLMIAVAAFAVACNNATDTTTVKTDSVTTVVTDSTTIKTDTVKVMDTTTMKKDSVK